MRLIDADDTLDTIEKYCGDYFNHDDQSFDKNAVRIAIKMAETIDPVHAAGGYYCKECIYKEESTVKNPKDYWCQLRDSYMDLNGFCSEGRKDDTKNG